MPSNPTTRWRPLVLVAAAAAVFPAGAWAAGGDFYGVVSQGPLSDADFSRMDAGGVGTLRFALSWQKTEPAQGEFDWSEIDPIVAGASRAGVRLLPSVAGTPSWLSGDAARPPVENAKQRTAWRRFLRALIARYGPAGDFWTQREGGPIRDWQIWNEPNFTRFWEPRPSARDFAKLVRAAAGAIRAADPGARIVLGGVAPVRRGPRPGDFLERLYAVRGIERHFDVVAVHPYAPDLFGLGHQLDEVRSTMDRSRDRRTPIIVSELGWASAGPVGYGLVRGPSGQARMLERAFGFLRARSRRYRLEGVQWFAWQDARSREARCAFCKHSGLFTLDRRPKPAWRSFKKFTVRSP